ncbi:MAG TPA: CPBP family intramembrane glutamic endopeptidase [Longimicrobiaceae bacterium]
MSRREEAAEGRRLGVVWRILLWLVLLLLFYLAGQYAVSLLPRTPLGWAAYLVLSAGGLMAGWAVLVRVDGRPPGALGFALSREAITETVVGTAFGGALIALAVLLLLLTGSAIFVVDSGSALDYASSLGWTLLYFWLAAAYEEIWFRGYGFQALVEGVGPWPAVIASSALFSLLHAANPNFGVAAFVNIFLAGVLLALAYLRTRSLWFATAVHAGWNWAMASLFAFPVSGLTMIDTPLYDAVEVGRDWWTGGAFGPEAGVAGTLVLIVGVWLLIRGPLPRESAHVRALGPIVDRRLPASWP